jgi:Translocon-associated protein beta (TRAPB)
VTFNITVRPKIRGQYESTRAKIKYNPTTVVMEDVAPDFRNGVSSSLGRIRIVSEEEFVKLKSSGMKTWLMVGIAALSALTLIVSYLLRGKKIEKKSSGKQK